jgi:outer membrane protein OmpA-like peptidoglycan-associated protein
MKNAVKLALVLVLSLGVIISLIACSEQSSQQPLSAAIIIGSHANSRNLNFSNEVVVDTVKQAIRTYGLVSIICADGNPDLISSNLYDIPDAYKQASAQKLSNDATKKAGELLRSLTTIKADDEEVDLLESLRLAVRSLSTAPAETQKRIVVIDSGLSTTGLLDFNSLNIAAEPYKIAQYLSDLQAIPDFDGITVSWHQIGDTASPQEKLTPEQRNQLISIWQTIVEKTGGIFETSSIVANPGDIDATDLPNVSAVQLANINAPLIPQAQVKPQVIEPIIFSEEQVHFVGDKAIYVNAIEAEAAIKPTAEFMLANPNFTALLVGTTAGNTSNDFTYKLSGDRAAKVRETLIKFGVPAERIKTIGLASSDPWHIPDTDNKGKMNENNATQNRKVVLLDLTSEMAQEIINPQQ